MRRRQSGIRTANWLAASIVLAFAVGSEIEGISAALGADRVRSEITGYDRPGPALDTTGMSGARPGCVPRLAGSPPAAGDVRPENGVVAGAGLRAPRMVEDHTVGSSVDTGAGETRAFPRGASGSVKANDC